MRAFFLAVSISVFFSGLCLAQLSQPARFEKELKSSPYHFTVISMNENGLALIRQEDKYQDGNHFFEIILLDSALQETWTNEVTVNNQSQLIGYEYAQNDLYFLYRRGETNMGSLHLLKINTLHHEMTSYEIEPKLDFKLSYFTIVGNSAVLAGYVSQMPTVFLYAMETHRSKVIPGFFLKDTELLDLRVNRNNTFNVLLMERNIRGKNQLMIKTFDDSGVLIIDDAFEIDGDKTILSGITSTLERDELLLAGTWGHANGKLALGIFSVAVDPFNKHPIQYYDFSQLNHFLDYLTPRKAQRIKTRARRRKVDGKLPSYGVYLNVCKLEDNEEGFMLLSEIYSPFSNMNSRSSYPYYNPYDPFGSTGYGGYGYGYSPYATRYSPYSYGNPTRRADVTVMHSSVVIFDPQGKIKEDAGLKFIEVKWPSLEQISDFSFTDKKIFQVYKSEKDIHFSTSSRDSTSTVEHAERIQLKSPIDILRKDMDDYGAVRHWFGPCLYVWGYETVREKAGSGNPTRYVFYINKLRVA